MTPLLEVAVDDPAGVSAAIEGGADRLELCAALEVGGLTPSFGLMRVAAGCGLPFMAMIRPRAGGFVYSEAELAAMEADARLAIETGAKGIVIGILTPGLKLELTAMQRMIRAAEGKEITLHRAFDLVDDWRQTVDQAVDLGIRRILTSGGALSAVAGVNRLAEVMDHAAGRIIIMPGAGISAETLPDLTHLPLTEVHASCGAPLSSDPRALSLGFSSRNARGTDAGRVRALKAALSH